MNNFLQLHLDDLSILLIHFLKLVLLIPQNFPIASVYNLKTQRLNPLIDFFSQSFLQFFLSDLIFDLIATSYVANNFYSNYKTRNKGQSPWPKQINQINQM